MPRQRAFTLQADMDPLVVLTRPPPNETPQEKIARETREKDARKVSDEIDRQLKAEHAQLKQQNKTLPISGKSTTLKNFRLAYAPEEFAAEKASWKAVIHLNLIRTVGPPIPYFLSYTYCSLLDQVLVIMQEVKVELDAETSLHPSSGRTSSGPGTPIERNSRHSSQSPTPYSEASPVSERSDHSTLSFDIATLNVLLLRLSPLRSVEAELKKRLGGGSIEVGPEDNGAYGVLPNEDSMLATNGKASRRKIVQEWAVRANLWKNDDDAESPQRPSFSDVSLPLLTSLQDDIQSLWSHPRVQAILKRRQVLRQIEESPGGFFLKSLARVISPTYVPSDQDVVRARLRTLGVQETKIWFGSAGAFLGHDFGREWILYDVGGSRSMRHAWLPFFDNVQAIIFLAPISCFDEHLIENPKVNRIEDSIQLWTSICSSRLISPQTTLILFLNKCDLLERKLTSGVQIKDYLPSYGDRENSTKQATKYFKRKFRDIVVQKSKQSRVCYIYPTSVTDTKATRMTLETVKDGILREYLRYSDFM
ncbi:G-protein alpha subunit [Flagelloscypha sp. PMI_526]|nr:G-protein alpha subunit [Flagelloscypha sp. PMI_526]